MAATPDVYRRIYDAFQAPVSRFDCGRKCAPLNNGQPVCCTTDHAVPVVDRAEWQLLRSRSKLWHLYKPSDAAGRKVISDLHRTCVGIECKGARHCERDNRSMSCRTFPFFPYITAEGEFAALAYFWTFEDRCWIQSNLSVVDLQFIREFVAAYELLFSYDVDEFKANRDHSAMMRRTFSRWNRIIPLLGREGGYFAVEPRTHVIRPAQVEEFPRHEAFRDELAPAPAA
ncbi:MAG: hypothetical protein JNL66_19535 [Alphaproteobacteria bacterium]|nr:hypothetical protein [Alphaproteobacteria bacterium]